MKVWSIPDKREGLCESIQTGDKEQSAVQFDWNIKFMKEIASYKTGKIGGSQTAECLKFQVKCVFCLRCDGNGIVIEGICAEG